MFKKIISLVLVLMALAGMAIIATPASAAESKIYFEVPSDWKNYKSVFCHLWAYGGSDPLANWQSKKEKCTQVEGNLYSYDTTKVGGLDAGTTYCVIFSLDTGMETYTTLMSTACYGDTLYCNDTYYENPVDSSKTSRAAFWKNHSASEFGPLMQVTSIGNIVGTCLAPGATAKSMFADFLTNTLDNARTYSGKEDQAIVDGIAVILGLSQKDIKDVIAETGVTVDWSPEEIPTNIVIPEVEAKPINPQQPGNSGAVSTGQEMTIVYIATAMMIAAAGVIFFARKKRVEE